SGPGAMEGSRGARTVRPRDQHVHRRRVRAGDDDRASDRSRARARRTAGAPRGGARAPDGPPSLAEWKGGSDPAPAPPADLSVTEGFAFDGDAFVWRVALANP